jgi:hypothetical protein
VTKARFTGRCVIQQLDRLTGIAQAGTQGNCSFVVDVTDGDLYDPPQRDQYSIKVFMPDNVTLWWGSVTTPIDLGSGGNGGGNVTIHSQ